MVEGKGLEGVGVSVSHSDSYLVVVVGRGEQGCDVEVIKSRSINEWKNLLDKKFANIFDILLDTYKDKDILGAGLWCIAESYFKLFGQNDNEINIGEFSANHLSLTVKANKIKNNGVAVFIKLYKNVRVAIGYAQSIYEDKEILRDLIYTDKLFKDIGYNPEAFQSRLEYSGPQEQLVFIKNYPITFKTNKLLSKRVYFTSYFDWIGEIREQSANPIMEYLAGKFQTGDWGIATYSTKLEILGELKANDILETHFWSEKVDSKIKGTYDLCIDWKRITPNKQKERIAFSRQRIIWVKVVSHGVAQVEELPNFIEIFMDTMKPRIQEKKPLEELPFLYKNLKKGEKIISFNNINEKYLLIEKVISTTLENSNLVGNIYFSNYAKWLGSLIDSYFYKLIPEYYKGNGESGEFACLNCEINHLSEAMPFDDILVRMHIGTMYKNAMDLNFDFYLVKEGKLIRKLAFAKYETIWVKRFFNDEIRQMELPRIIVDQFAGIEKI